MLELLRQPAVSERLAFIGCALLVAATLVFGHYLVSRPSFPDNAPKYWKPDTWPIVGAWRFFSHRHDMYRDAQNSSPTGHFSFHIGKRPIIGLSGLEGRKTFFESRDLDINEGAGDLFAGLPVKGSQGFYHNFTRTIINLTKTTTVARNLYHLTSASRVQFDNLAAAPFSNIQQGWRVMNPFDTMQELIFKYTLRAMGAQEICEDQKLLAKTLHHFEQFEKHASPASITFPWLLTPNQIIRMWNAIQLYRVFDKIIKDRARTGKPRNDPLQQLIDEGQSIREIVEFELAALFAGLINSGIHAAYLPLYWANSPDVKARIRDEVDGVIAQNRRSDDQSPSDVLDTLTIQQWETQFPFIHASLREAVRLGQPGATFRKNTSGVPVPIGKTGEVIPPGAYVAYMMDDINLDPVVYPEPLSFHPDRYENPTEGMKEPHSYPSWGSGRHPCLGSRFAKLEMSLANAYFVAKFDWELSDENGNPWVEPFPVINRNLLTMTRPEKDIFIRYKEREY